MKIEIIRVFYFFSIVFGVFIISCNNDEGNGIYKEKDVVELSYKTDTIFCPYLSSKVLYFQAVDYNDSTFIYILPTSLDSIRILQYKGQETYLYNSVLIPNQVKTNNDYGFDEAHSMFVLNKDTVVFVQQNSQYDFLFSLYSLKDRTIDILYKTNGADLVFFNTKFTNYYPNFVFNSSNGDLYIDVVRNDDLDLRDRTMDSEMLCKINIMTKDFSFVDCKYPIDFEDYYFIPTSNNYSYIIKDNCLLMSFPYISKLLKYNIESGEVNEIDMSSRHEKEFFLFSKMHYDNANQEQYMDLINDTKCLSFAYSKILWNAFESYYYRFYELEQEKLNSDGNISKYMDKLIAVVIYDEDFNYIDDYILGKRSELNNPFLKASYMTASGIIIYNSFDLQTKNLFVSRIVKN